METHKLTDVAPIAFFVYNRPSHTRQAVEALQRNELASSSELFVFSDGPRAAADVDKVEAVREYLRRISGFKKVTIVERERNLGCACSIIGGITEIVNRYGRIIVVEDDIVTAPYFLRYMNEALTLYQDDEEVACIHGYMYPVKEELPETFFVRGADIWGWGTWKRAWDFYEFNAGKLLEKLNASGLVGPFNFDGAANFTDILEAQVHGKVDTWDVQWCATAYLRGMLVLYPSKSLVKNIGFDSSGTHNRTTENFNVELGQKPVQLQRIPIKENAAVRESLKKFHKNRTSLLNTVINRMRSFFVMTII